jgi:hypothetical protein
MKVVFIRQPEAKNKEQSKKNVFVKMPNDMYEQLREFADKRGLSVSAAIRLLVSEGLSRERE